MPLLNPHQLHPHLPTNPLTFYPLLFLVEYPSARICAFHMFPGMAHTHPLKHGQPTRSETFQQWTLPPTEATTVRGSSRAPARSMLDCWLLDLEGLLCRQPQLLWGPEGSGLVRSRRRGFLLPGLWLLESFQPFCCDGPWAAAGRRCPMCDWFLGRRDACCPWLSSVN